jgi:hypothetical protein
LVAGFGIYDTFLHDTDAIDLIVIGNAII